MEYVVCLTCINIASTRPHHTVDAGQNRGVGGWWHNVVGGFVGGAVFVFKLFGGVGVSLVGFKVDGALNLAELG